MNRGYRPDGVRRHVLNGIRGEQGNSKLYLSGSKHKMKYILCQNLLGEKYKFWIYIKSAISKLISEPNTLETNL